MLVRVNENETLSSLLVGVETGAAPMIINVYVPQKAQNRAAVQLSSNTLLDTHFKDSIFHNGRSCTSMLAWMNSRLWFSGKEE